MSAPDTFERKLQKLAASITEAATAYEARWTLAALHRVDPDIHGRLRRQIDLWQEASRHGGEDEIVAQGEALVRGYRRAVEIMVGAGAADDAYILGVDEVSGLRVAIGDQVAAADRVAALHPGTIWLSTDEVAGLLNSLDGFAAIAAMKRAWPAAVALPQRPVGL